MLRLMIATRLSRIVNQDFIFNTLQCGLHSGGELIQPDTVNYFALCDPVSGATSSNTNAAATATLQRMAQSPATSASSQSARHQGPKVLDQNTVGTLSKVDENMSSTGEISVSWGEMSCTPQSLCFWELSFNHFPL